jgi:DNA polymerase
MFEILFDGTFAGWKRAARAALEQEHMPAQTRWIDQRSAQNELMLAGDDFALRSPEPSRLFRVPREFMKLATDVSCHRDESRWALLYRALWRITHDEPHLLDIAVDRDVSELVGMAKAVRREVHKMHAFVRFREVAVESGTWFVAWFEPQHHVVEAAAPFFRDRFAEMKWSILTPDVCAHWDLVDLRFTPGVSADSAPQADVMEDLWRTYYSSIFNPARLKLGAMTSEMPRHYWKNLPEAKAIPSLIAAAGARVEEMAESSYAKSVGAGDFTAAPVPAARDLGLIRDAAATCRACPLWRNATCTVFGEGSPQARVVVVGEQPGDQEDRSGKPFVGPAGLLFNRALAAAGLNRDLFYVTNAVKHFKWEPRGKRRLHQKPNAREVAACRPWLQAEIQTIRPDLIVCLGATAAQSVVGRSVRVLSERGQKLPTEFGIPALVTVHPSALLRLPDGVDPAAAFDRFVEDLREIAKTR